MAALPSAHVVSVAHGDRLIHVLGTAHVSRASVDEVDALIREVRPDSVCIELCAARFEALTDPARWKKLDIFQVFREGKSLFLIANLAISAYQRRLGAQLGVMPGAELLKGAEAASAVGAELVLADRDVHITLKRTWAALSLWKRAKLLAAILASFFERPARPGEPTMDAAAVEALKDQSNLGAMMRELARHFPEIKRPLIDERDLFLASRIAEAPGKTVVAVVGAGHVEGLVTALRAELTGSVPPIDRAALEVLPAPGRVRKVLRWFVPAVLVAFFFVGLENTEGRALGEMIVAWVLPTSLFSGALTALAGGRLASIGSALLCSPLTTIHPLIASSMIVGPVEAWARKPTVADTETLHRDVQTVRGFFRNPFTRTLIVASAAGLGSAIGAAVGLSWVLSIAS